MRTRALTAVAVACAIGAALFAMAADRGDGLDPVAEPRARVASPAPAKEASPAKEGAAGAGKPAPPKRARVSAGVLARAASRRAQEREGSGPAANERRRGREPGEVLSVEIDWHASAVADH